MPFVPLACNVKPAVCRSLFLVAARDDQACHDYSDDTINQLLSGAKMGDARQACLPPRSRSLAIQEGSIILPIAHSKTLAKK